MNSLAVSYNEASHVQWHTEALWLDQAAVVMLLANGNGQCVGLVP